ncbi:hypothetical protein [Haloarchaeobius sp. DFWS5]|uniref:hypothetical protein n=1 Tax=Haloarchaeobius sp. DFWS5 TaxID=3446114 RepID=UPI003EC0913C
MRALLTLRRSVRIASVDRVRRSRKNGPSSTLRPAALVAVMLAAVVAVHGVEPAVGDGLFAGIAAGSVGLCWHAARQTTSLLARLQTDLLLTAVTTRDIVLGMALVVAAELVVLLVVPAVGVAVGLVVHGQPSTTLLTIPLSVVGLVGLVTMAGVTVGFAVALGVWSWRRRANRRTRRVVTGMAVLCLVVGVPVLGVGGWSVSRLVGWVDAHALPTAWFVDAALLGTSVVHATPSRTLAAVCLVGGGIPVLFAAALALASRTWNAPLDDRGSVESASAFGGTGLAVWLFGDRVTRPTLTVARRRWVQERRAPQGLLTAGYILLVLPIVFMPLLDTGTMPVVFVVVLAWLLAAGTGIAFGLQAFTVDYSTLSLTLTSVRAEQFVRGIVLAGVAVGAPVTVAVTAATGLTTAASVVEVVVLAALGLPLCICGSTLGAALGTRIPYDEFWPVPMPGVSKTVYSEMGVRSFLRLAALPVLLGLVCLPALVATPTVVAESLGVPVAVVRLVGLCSTAALAAAVSKAAFHRAVLTFERYEID